MMHYLTRNGLFLIATVFMAAPLTIISTAQAESENRIWTAALTQVRGCGAVLNETVSEGAHCLFERGLNFVLDQGIDLADERGKRAFGQHFQIVGNLAYSRSSGRTGLQGDLDLVIPLVGGEPVSGERASSSALFLQQGITRWWDAHGSLHNDVRQGLVYRFRVSEGLDADVLGISMLHLVNAEHQHAVLVPGFDYSGKWGSSSFRYFSPTTGGRLTRLGYEERALEGMELATRVDITSTVRVNTTGYRWQSEDGSGSWIEGARLDVGWRPHPWLNITAGYDRPSNAEGTASVLVRFTMPIGGPSKTPRWEGLGVTAGGSAPNDSELWRPIDGVGQIRVATHTTVASLVNRAEVRFLQSAVNSGNTVQLEVVLPEAAQKDIRVEVRLVPGSGDNPAVAGVDYIDQPVETTITKGSTSATVSIQLLRNDEMEENRSLSATVSLVS